MSDASSEGTAESPPSRKPTPWSVRKIVEQVTGRPLESMQDPPGTRRPTRASSPPPSHDPPLERYHQEGPAVTVLVEPEEAPRALDTGEEDSARLPQRRSEAEPEEIERSPSLRAFLPGAPAPAANGRAPRVQALPLTRPLPREVVEEVDRMRAEEGEAPLGRPSGAGHAHATRELERVYLSYLLMHLDRLTEPALKYLRHAVEEECEERGLVH